MAPMTQIHLPTIAEAIFRVRQALSEKLPAAVRQDLRGIDYHLTDILRGAGLEPGHTALHADAAKLQAMGQPPPKYAAPPLVEENERLRARVAELEVRLAENPRKPFGRMAGSHAAPARRSGGRV